ncbi:MAG: transposase [bacterium]
MRHGLVEEYVTKNDPVRVYDAFVESLNLRKLGIILQNGRVGNSAYNPKFMIKLLVYGCSYGIRSSRKAERSVPIIYHLSGFYDRQTIKP